MARRQKPVMGVEAPAPRITPRAVWLAIRHVGLPLLAGLVAFDIVVWLVAEALWDICIGIWCWL